MSKYRSLFLIDDDEDDQLLFRDALQQIDKGLAFLTADNGVEALKLLEPPQVFPDIIFLDLNMPVMNGFEFLAEVRKFDHLQQIPIVIFTTSSNPDHVLRTHALGARAFITKPSSFSALRNKLSSVLNMDLALWDERFLSSDYLL
jgi:CheY-like chemotaxis protein